MSELSKDYGTVDYDNLVIRSGDVGSIQLSAGQGTLKKGSVIDDKGMLLNSTSSIPAYVLCDATVTDDTETTTGIIYKNGCFIRESLITDKGYALTDADVEKLRDVGIIVESAR